jgi:formate dehydrogenase (hydrogenase)
LTPATVGRSRRPDVSRRSRLTTPLVRARAGLEPASWEEALERTATALDQHRGTEFGLFSCSKATNETNFLAQKFARVVMGSNNIDSCNRT